MAILSRYRILWMIVMFDLPVLTKQERKEANAFRKRLQNQGFERCQFSVYLRWCSGKEVAERYLRQIKGFLPEGGKVDIVTITDKQYEQIISFVSNRRTPRKKRDQYSLF